jgi:uncharacterized protein (TIGR00375 family)
MAEWGEKKGIDLLGTADWTHPMWFKELETQLEEDGEGIFKVKGSESSARYVLTCEISNIYSQGGQTRRIHTVFMAPSLETVRKINDELRRRGGNLMSDGRPILGLTIPEMCEIVWGIDEKVIVVPAHIWTPWFSMFGSKSGFDSVEECFGEYADRITAVETGLSSDPVMNWRIKDLEQRSIISFSDAHSPRKLGREVTVFEFEGKKISFGDIAEAFKREEEGKCRISYTVEFHPEEGKYHYTGHRNCGVVQSPEETRKKGAGCHVCGKSLTVGVMHRVEELAEVKEEMKSVEKKSGVGVVGHYHPEDKSRPPYVMLVPLQEIISEAFEVGVNSKRVQEMYEQMIAQIGSEFDVLLKVKVEEIAKVAGERVAEAVEKVRKGEIEMNPGYDGVFGEVKIWPAGEAGGEAKVATEQQSLF